MTGNMNMVMKFRDMQVADDFSKMAELGYLDKEFTMFGCAYWENDKRRYIISSEVEAIYDFIDSCRDKAIYCTPILSLTKICPVPSGCEDDIAKTVKLDLAKRLQNAYSKRFFSYVQQLRGYPAVNGAKAVLVRRQAQLEGYFQEETLQLFEGLAQYAFERKVLDIAAYQQFNQWLAVARKEMEDDVVLKDVFERTFYGFAYRGKNDQVIYFCNANKGTVSIKKNGLDNAGILTTPIFSKKYWFNYTYTLPQVRETFKNQIKTAMNEEYLAMVTHIHQCETAIDKKQYQQLLTLVQQEGSEEAVKAFQLLGLKAGIPLG